MAKYTHNDVLDAPWNHIKSNCSRQIACSGQPATYYEAVEADAFLATTAYTLGQVMRPATRNGFVYEVTVAGTTAAAEPTWPTAAGSTVISGTATLTARASYALADVAMVAGDFTMSDGTTSGRKMTVGAKAGVPIDVTGTANHVALIDDTNKKLLYVTTASALALTAGAGNAVNFPAWNAEFADPV